MIATVVLAYFAYLQIRREQHADERRRQATEMQISGPRALSLRCLVRSLLGTNPLLKSFDHPLVQ